MSLLIINNANVSAQKDKQCLSNSVKTCKNCGEELSSYDSKALCSSACRQERNIRLQIASRAYKNLQ
jgi:transcription initiation factor IIE alpha subunit